MRIRKTGLKTVNTIAEQEFSGGIEGETKHKILEIYSVAAFTYAGLELSDCDPSVVIEKFEVGYSVARKCWPSDRTVEPKILLESCQIVTYVPYFHMSPVIL